MVVLTISSIVFRLLLILHFDENDSTRGYYLKEGDEQPFQEAFLEICNLCCGAMNQELLRYFPDLGMSTPYVLSARCLGHLPALKPGFCRRIRSRLTVPCSLPRRYACAPMRRSTSWPTRAQSKNPAVSWSCFESLVLTMTSISAASRNAK